MQRLDKIRQLSKFDNSFDKSRQRRSKKTNYVIIYRCNMLELNSYNLIYTVALSLIILNCLIVLF
jgi:hypothetical protein